MTKKNRRTREHHALGDVAPDDGDGPLGSKGGDEGRVNLAPVLFEGASPSSPDGFNGMNRSRAASPTVAEVSGSQTDCSRSFSRFAS